MSPRPGVPIRQVARLEERLCDRCRECLPACSVGALVWVRSDDELLIDPWACSGCGDCLPRCPPRALSLVTVAAA